MSILGGVNWLCPIHSPTPFLFSIPNEQPLSSYLLLGNFVERALDNGHANTTKKEE